MSEHQELDLYDADPYSEGSAAVEYLPDEKPCRVPDDRRCVAAAKTGMRCGKWIDPDSQTSQCNFHDPDLMSITGGPTPGAGRPRKLDARALMQAAIEREASVIIEKALGTQFRALDATQTFFDVKNGEVVASPEPDWNVRLRAAEQIVTRIGGKPTAHQEINVNHNKVSSRELLEAAEQAARAEVDRRERGEETIVDATVIMNELPRGDDGSVS